MSQISHNLNISSTNGVGSDAQFSQEVYVNDYSKNIINRSRVEEFDLDNKQGRSSVRIYIKRFIDVAVAICVILLIFSWFLPIIGVFILMESQGPILFLQKRSGLNGQEFICIKFRTMVYEKNVPFVQATSNDQRITKIGMFLRKTNMDELPQIFNVLWGTMTLVGPRPHPILLDEQFVSVIPNYYLRNTVKPGITGWAQSSGYRGETRELIKMQKRVEHDVWYIENWSLWFDIRIIMMTIKVTLIGDKNAY